MDEYRIHFSGVFSEESRDPIQIVVNDSTSGAIISTSIVANNFEFRARPYSRTEPVLHFGSAVKVIGASKNEVHLGLGHAMFNKGSGKIVLKTESFANNGNYTDTVQIEDAIISKRGDQVEVNDRTSGGAVIHRQALAPEGLVDIDDLGGGGIYIKFYENGEFGTTPDSYGMYPTSGYSPFVTYEITDPDETDDDLGYPIDSFPREFSVKRITSSYTDIFEVNETRNEIDIGGPVDIETIAYIDDWHKDGASVAVKYNRENYKDGVDGDVSTIIDTLDGSNNVVDTKIYDTGGGWESHSVGYTGDDIHVLYRKEISGSGSDPYEITTNKTNGKTKTYTFTDDNIGTVKTSAIGDIKKVEETFLNDDYKLVTEFTDFVEDSAKLRAWPETATTTYNVGADPVVYNTTATYNEEYDSHLGENIFRKVETNYSLDGESYETVTRSYRWDEPDVHLRNKVISVERSDGSKVVNLIQKGDFTYSPITLKYGFNPGAAGGTAIRVVTLTGKTHTWAGPGTDPDADKYDHIDEYNSADIDDLDMLTLPYGDAGKSTAQEAYFDSMGRLFHKATYVYTTTGFQRMFYRQYSYNEYGKRISEYDWITSPATPNRIYYSAVYTDNRKTSETNADGVVTEFEYDDYGRVKDKIVKGKSVSPWVTPGDIYTTFVRDAVGRPLTETVHDDAPTNPNSLTTTYNYDTANRIKTIKDPANLTTAFSYAKEVGGTDFFHNVTTVTYPNDSTKITTLFKDGKVSTIDGTAEPKKTYEYGYETSGAFIGCLWRKETTGASGIRPWTKSYKDWLKRPVKSEHPMFENVGTVVHEYHYDDETGQLAQETFKNGSTVISPGQVYAYSFYGELDREGIDTNGNGGVDISTDHSVIEHFWQFQKFSTGWYRFKGQGLYGDEGSSTMTSLESAYTKISAFSVGLTGSSTIGYVAGIDKYGNWSHHYTEADRINAKIVKKSYIDDTTSEDLLASEITYINGLEVDSSNAQGHLFSKHYDSIGRMEYSIDSRSFDTEYSYNSLGQIEWEEDKYGIKSYYEYNSDGELVAEKQDNLKATRFQYDAMGRVEYVWGEVPLPVKYEYNDPLGRMTKMVTYRSGSFISSTFPTSAFQGTGDETIWQYDNYSGLLKKKTDDDGKYTEYKYTASGQLDQKRNPRGFWIDYNYYAPVNPVSGGQPGALHEVKYPSPYNDWFDVRFTPDITYKYKRHGGYDEVKEGSTTVFNNRKFTYDSYFEITQEDLATGAGSGYFYDTSSDVINYSYDFDSASYGFYGRLKSFNFRSDSVYKNTYEFDVTGRIDTITGDHSSSTAFDYTYHDDTNIVDNLVHGDYSQEIDYRSDSYRLDKLIHKWGTDTADHQEARFTYDSLGRRVYEKVEGLIEETLRPSSDNVAARSIYNDRNEISFYRLVEMIGWTVQSGYIGGTYNSFHYDNIGNRKYGHQDNIWGNYSTADSTYSHGGLNQYKTARGLTTEYDAAGNLDKYDTTEYEYDAEDRLVEVKIGSTEYKYKYDYLGRRIAKYTNSTLDKKFIYQGWNLIAETSSIDAIQRTFTWGLDLTTTLQGAGGVGGLLMIDDESTNKRYYPIYDGSRNIVGLYDHTGALAAAYEYDAFGRLTNEDGDYWDDNPFRYSTKYTDKETGLVYYGKRFYSSALGRFINRDPIAEDGGMNLYGFVGNNPSNSYDYLGMVPDDDDEEEEDPWEWDGGFYFDGDEWRRDAVHSDGWTASLAYNPFTGDVSFDTFNGVEVASNHLGNATGFGQLISMVGSFEDSNDFFDDYEPTYADKTFNHVVYGEFSDDVTGLGLAIEIVPAIIGIDAPLDIRDLSANIAAWEWSFSHAGKTTLTAAALVPVVGGAIKGAKRLLQLRKAANKGLCFAAGTLVAMADGSEKPIEEVEKGDIVKAYDLESDEVVEREVLETFENYTYYWVDVVADGDSVSATRGHQFWVESDKQWIEASHLEVGMSIRLKDGRVVPVESVAIRELEEPEATFNFIVEDEHNYYVGEDGILVHNGYPESPKYPPPTQVGENFQLNFDDSPHQRNSRSAGVRRATAAGNVQPGEIGHHINSVQSHSHLAAEPDNIEGVKTEAQHRAKHGGNYQNATSGPLQKVKPGC
jgi:RHS repeat-associated protein